MQGGVRKAHDVSAVNHQLSIENRQFQNRFLVRCQDIAREFQQARQGWRHLRQSHPAQVLISAELRAATMKEASSPGRVGN